MQKHWKAEYHALHHVRNSIGMTNLQRVLLSKQTLNADPMLALRLNPYSAGIDFNRQNLTSVDVRF